MARPKKIGLDYFPVDTSFDDKMQSFDLIHKNDAITFIIYFWQSAYKTETGEVDLSGLFGELMANKCRITTDKLSVMLETAKKLDLLYQTDAGLWTSNGIKKRIQAVSKERSDAILRQEEKKVNKSKVKETPHYSANNSNNSENNPKKHIFSPPSLEEFQTYFIKNGYTIDYAKRAFNGYQEAQWHDSRGQKIKNWKQKAQHVWFKPEMKITTNHPYQRLS